MSQGRGQMVCFEVLLQKAQVLPQKSHHGHNIAHCRYRAVPVVASHNKMSFSISCLGSIETSNSMHGSTPGGIFFFFFLCLSGFPGFFGGLEYSRNPRMGQGLDCATTRRYHDKRSEPESWDDSIPSHSTNRTDNAFW